MSLSLENSSPELESDLSSCAADSESLIRWRMSESVPEHRSKHSQLPVHKQEHIQFLLQISQQLCMGRRDWASSENGLNNNSRLQPPVFT